MSERLVRRFAVASLFSISIGILGGCASAARENIKDVMLPLAVVRKVVMDNVPGGLKKQSINGREITGEYYNALNIDEPSDTAPQRAQATITILGSRRPYAISIAVFREQRAKGSKTYSKLGLDSKLAKQVEKRLREALANRPADINVIDDFRAF